MTSEKKDANVTRDCRFIDHRRRTFIPQGVLDGAGVQPDIDIDLADDMKELPIEAIDQDDDAQLWAALDEVRAQADERENAAEAAE